MRRSLAILSALLLAASSAAAQERSITLADYAVDVRVRRDGTAIVSETIRARFDGTWNGIYRDIALRHETGQGVKERLRIDSVQVFDVRNQPLEFWDEDGDNGDRRIRVRVPGASDATRTLTIRYLVRNGIRHFYPGDSKGTPNAVREFDELYWNATGNAWAFPIEHATAHVVLPDGVYPTSQSAYTGASGSTASDATLRVQGNAVTAEVSRVLSPGEGLTIAVAFPAGVVPRPTLAELRRQKVMMWWPLALPFLAFGLMFRRWWRVGRDPREQSIVVQYAPPDGMTPAELGTLVDNSADLKDITSTLVDLAVRGYIGIEEVENKHVFGLFSTTEWIFHRRREGTDLQPHEKAFIGGLFSGAHDGPAWEVVRARRAAGEEYPVDAYRHVSVEVENQPFIRMSELKDRFYAVIPGIKDAVYDRLVQRGYYLKRPDKVKGTWVAFGIATMVLSGIGAGFVGEMGHPAFGTFPLAIGGIAAGLIILGFGLAMAARTVKGARAREAALGFREFLRKVESDRYRQMITGPELFERYLPHAMAFGVEARWARAFEDLYHEPPEWYSGSRHRSFSSSSFTDHMCGFSSTCASTMSSSPSGSSGGGSSGGGSGGGGGGGW